MRKGTFSGKTKRTGSQARVSVLFLSLMAAAGAQADPSMRLTPFLRQQAMPQERLAPAMAMEPLRRQEAPDEARNPRRWSPEERRQLRRDVHDAGRDVYGQPPRRPD